MRPVFTGYSCFHCASCTQSVTWWSTVRHVLPPVAVAAGRVEGGAGSALVVVGEAVGTLDKVGAVRGVRVQPVVPFLAERFHAWRNGALIIDCPAEVGRFICYNVFNPFTAPACTFSGLKKSAHIHACKLYCPNSKHRFTTTFLPWRKVPESDARSVSMIL